MAEGLHDCVLYIYTKTRPSHHGSCRKWNVRLRGSFPWPNCHCESVTILNSSQTGALTQPKHTGVSPCQSLPATSFQLVKFPPNLDTPCVDRIPSSPASLFMAPSWSQGFIRNYQHDLSSSPSATHTRTHTHKHTHIPTCIYALKNSMNSIRSLAPVMARSYKRLSGLSTWLEPFSRTSNHTAAGVCSYHTVLLFILRNHIVCLGLKRQLEEYQTGTQLTRRTRKRSTRPDKKEGCMFKPRAHFMQWLPKRGETMPLLW